MVTAAGGFNPTWQRHVAAYSLADGFLPPGRLLDVGCGIGHSYHLLSPRETVGLDISADALKDQDRETVNADMRALPFGEGAFGSVLSVQSLGARSRPRAGARRGGPASSSRAAPRCS